jgi:hypothetical protein
MNANKIEVSVIPNGIITFSEFISSEEAKGCIAQYNEFADGTTEEKIRAFLCFYQTYETLARCVELGSLPDTMDGVFEVTLASTAVVQEEYDTIMESLTEDERQFLNYIFSHSSTKH